MRIAHSSRSLISAANSHSHRVVSLLSFPLSRSSTTTSQTLTQAPPSAPTTMASESDNLSTIPAANGNVVEDEKFGFRRPEMFTENLAGTVGAYDRHVFLCYKSPEAWPSKVEGSESDPLPKLLSSAVKARKNDIALKVSSKKKKKIWISWLISAVNYDLCFVLNLLRVLRDSVLSL